MPSENFIVSHNRFGIIGSGFCFSLETMSATDATNVGTSYSFSFDVNQLIHMCVFVCVLMKLYVSVTPQQNWNAFVIRLCAMPSNWFQCSNSINQKLVQPNRLIDTNMTRPLQTL